MLLPLVYLNTHIHELCHALAALATGGEAMRIEVFSNGSGVTPVLGGWLTVVASAGYVGSALVGAGMIFFSRTQRAARVTLFLLATALTLSMLAYVRGDVVGIISGIFWSALLFVLAKVLKPGPVVFAAQFIGVTQCLNAGYSILTLLKLSTGAEIQSDATLMENATHLPAMLWAVVWAGLSLVLLVLTLRRAWRQAPQESQPKV